MSGHVMHMLVRAENKLDAVTEAEAAIATLFERGDLVTGDKGYIAGREGSVRQAKADPAAFARVLRGLEEGRAQAAQDYLKEARRYAKQGGATRLEALRPEESSNRDQGMAGWALHRAGAILAGYFTPAAVLFNTDTDEAGVTETFIQQIERDPADWWLVEVVVG